MIEEPCTHPLLPAQVDQLLKAISPRRILQLNERGKKSYLAQQDVRAHLTRIFGFGFWSMDVVSTSLVHETQQENKNWLTAYAATVRLSIRCPDCGQEVAHYEDCAVGEFMPNPSRGAAHHGGLTTAVSTAMKRAASSLGDQFGLSLYNNGQTTAFVQGVLNRPGVPEGEGEQRERTSLPDVDVHGETDESGEDMSHSGTADGSVPQALTEAGQEYLVALEEWTDTTDATERIKGVAALKTQYAHCGYERLSFRGQVMTLDRLADLVATGKVTAEVPA